MKRMAPYAVITSNFERKLKWVFHAMHHLARGWGDDGERAKWTRVYPGRGGEVYDASNLLRRMKLSDVHRTEIIARVLALQARSDRAHKRFAELTGESLLYSARTYFSQHAD